MNCLECQTWLQRRLDGEATAPTDAVEQHWSECAACREQHAAATQLLDGLKQLPRPRPAPGFAVSLTASILRDRQHRMAKMRRRVYLTVAMAASILVLIFATYWWMPRTNVADPIAKGTEKKVEPPAPKAPDEPPAPKKLEPRNAIASLTDRWVDTTRDHAKVMLVATNLDAVENLPMGPLPALDPGVREAGQEVSDGVRAVTRNARRALDFFARELPMPEMGPQGNQ